jgi:hypothetical protein
MLKDGRGDWLVLEHAARAYLQASALEARGECDSAVAHYRRAFSLERALDADEAEWPAWLTEAVTRADASNPPPLRTLEVVRHGALMAAEHSAPDARAIAEQLRAQCYAVVDGLVSQSLAEQMGAEIHDAFAAGALAPGELHGNGSRLLGGGVVRAQRRGDWVAHVRDTQQPGWSSLRLACARVHELVSGLSVAVPTEPALRLGEPSAPMATRYADGARYAMHFDNDCLDQLLDEASPNSNDCLEHSNHCAEPAVVHSGVDSGISAASSGAEPDKPPRERIKSPAPPTSQSPQPCSNSRRLTCILYATRDWQPGDGGELRLFHTNATGSPDERHALTRAEVAPVAGRVLLFWSDYRCPHEVLPAWRERLAVTVWYARPAP